MSDLHVIIAPFELFLRHSIVQSESVPLKAGKLVWVIDSAVSSPDSALHDCISKQNDMFFLSSAIFPPFYFQTHCISHSFLRMIVGAPSVIGFQLSRIVLFVGEMNS